MSLCEGMVCAYVFIALTPHLELPLDQAALAQLKYEEKIDKNDLIPYTNTY